VIKGTEYRGGKPFGVLGGKRVAQEEGVHKQRAGDEVESDLDVRTGVEFATVDRAAHDGAAVFAGGAGELLDRLNEIW
jgi:hypothetical protein